MNSMIIWEAMRIAEVNCYQSPCLGILFFTPYFCCKCTPGFGSVFSSPAISLMANQKKNGIHRFVNLLSIFYVIISTDDDHMHPATIKIDDFQCVTQIKKLAKNKRFQIIIIITRVPFCFTFTGYIVVLWPKPLSIFIETCKIKWSGMVDMRSIRSN